MIGLHCQCGIINWVAVYKNFPDAIGYSFLFFSTEMVKIEWILSEQGQELIEKTGYIPIQKKK